MAQSAFGVIVRRRQVRMSDEGDHRLPVVEDLSREIAYLFLDLMLIDLAVPLDAHEQALDGVIIMTVFDPLDQSSQIANQIVAKATARTVITARECKRFADDVHICQRRHNAQNAIGGTDDRGRPRSHRSPAHQKSFADQGYELILGAPTDPIDDCARSHRHPQPHQNSRLVPGGFVNMDDLDCVHLLEELLDHSFADQAKFMDSGSIVTKPSSKPRHSWENSWIFVRNRRKRTDRAARRVASIGPNMQRSFSSANSDCAPQPTRTARWRGRQPSCGRKGAGLRNSDVWWP